MKFIEGAALADIAISVLQRTAMVLAEPANSGEPCAQPTRFARIAFWGPSTGTLVLRASDGFIRELAASLLGVETTEVDVETQGCDALKEMANMIAGSVILAMSGETCEYSLGLPEIVDSALAGVRASCTLVTECGSLSVIVSDVAVAKAA